MRRSLPVLTFHAIDDRPSVISFPPRLFETGLAKLARHGYRTVGLLDAVRQIRDRQSLPERSIVLTFDDGYRDSYDIAFPILKAYRMSATMFLTVGEHSSAASARLASMNGREMLSWTEIREMHDSGSVSFGAHTLTHPDLTRLSAQRVQEEIRRSRAAIEDALGAQVSSFAYPFGGYDRASRQIASRYFECACSDRLGLVTVASDLYALERVDAYYLRSQRLFDLLLSRSFSRYVWARNVPRRIRRAVLGGQTK